VTGMGRTDQRQGRYASPVRSSLPVLRRQRSVPVVGRRGVLALVPRFRNALLLDPSKSHRPGLPFPTRSSPVRQTLSCEGAYPPHPLDPSACGPLSKVRGRPRRALAPKPRSPAGAEGGRT